MSRATGAGRRGAEGYARTLIDLVGSLTDAGDFVSERAIERRLGCGPDQARTLFALVQTMGDSDGIALYEDEEGLALGDAGARGRRLRLTVKETFALSCALEALGVAEDDPLREKLRGLLVEKGIDEGLLARVHTDGEADRTAKVRFACSMALARHEDLAFLYRGAADAEERARTVKPLGLERGDNAWFLEAFDLDRQAKRSFRLDRMRDVRSAGHADGEGEKVGDGAPEPEGESCRLVRISFDDLRFLDLFVWPGLKIEMRDDVAGTASGTIPYYGGTWLARQIAGCGGHARVDDPELRALVADHARALLSITG